MSSGDYTVLRQVIAGYAQAQNATNAWATNNVITTTNTTQATSTTTGAIVAAGGVGVGGNIRVSGTVGGPNTPTMQYGHSNTLSAANPGILTIALPIAYSSANYSVSLSYIGTSLLANPMAFNILSPSTFTVYGNTSAKFSYITAGPV